MRNIFTALLLALPHHSYSATNAPKSPYLKRLFLLGFGIALSGVFVANAYSNTNNDWWFNIEVIAFKRTIPPGNTEDFSVASFESDFSKAGNLLYLEQIKKSNPLHAMLLSLPKCGEAIKENWEFDNLKFPESSVNVPVAEYPDLFDDLVDADTRMTQDEAKRAYEQDAEQISEIDDDLSKTVASLVSSDTSRLNNQAVLENRISRLNDELEAFLTELDILANVNMRLDCTPYSNLELIQPVTEFSQLLVKDAAYFTGYKHVLAQDELVLTELANNIFSQRDIQGLMHTAWRENIQFGVENADFMRLRAGSKQSIDNSITYEQWNEEYEANLPNIMLSENLQDSDKFFENIKNAIESQQTPSLFESENEAKREPLEPFAENGVFELDGMLKVYLDYVNQVPYLHIESEFKHYQVRMNDEGQAEFVEYPFNQRRRIISKQIHYFDHPAFGLVVRLERFTPPASETSGIN